jgi:hypothetical protein
MPSRWPAHRSACVVALGVAVATVTCALLVVEQRWSRSPSSTTLLTVSTAPKVKAREHANERARWLYSPAYLRMMWH